MVSDLDGTLLDHHDYSWRAAEAAVTRLRREGIPLVLASSKTRSEMVGLRHELANAHPFVVENGAAIYSPAGYFDTPPPHDPTVSVDPEALANAGALEIEWLGPSLETTLRILHQLREQHGFRFEGFADFGVEGIERHTGLPTDAARAASERDGTEPILWHDERSPDSLAEALAPHGLRLVRGGRFLHVMGEIDKARALKVLRARYERSFGEIRVIALGDSENDLDMLRAADHPVLIPRAVGTPLGPGPIPGLLRAPHPGPEGWAWALDHLLPALEEEE